jgi:hypothetical protein
MAPAVALERTRDAVYDLNLAARLGNSAAAEHIASLAGRRDVTSACCVGCGASRKLKTCSKCSVARFWDMECTARMWPAHKASCKAWRKEGLHMADRPITEPLVWQVSVWQVAWSELRIVCAPWYVDVHGL